MGYLFRKYAVNIPHWDDHALRFFIQNFEKSNSFPEKIQLVFKLHNEHRIVFTRIVSLLLFKTTGVLNFKWMMVVGNTALLGIFLLFIQLIRYFQLPFWIIAVISWVLFTPALSENFFWGMASVQNFWVIFLAFTTFYLLVFEKPIVSQKVRFCVAFFLAFLAIFTSGNGILVPIIGFLLLLFWQKRRATIVWILTFGIILTIYFLMNESRIDDPTGNQPKSLVSILKGIVILAGSGFDFQWILPALRTQIAFVFGILLLTISLWLFYVVLSEIKEKYTITSNQKIKTSANLFLLACLFFIAGTAIATVISRIGYGLEIFLTSKYKIYGILLLIICSLFIINRLSIYRKTNSMKYGLVFACLFWINAYLNDFQFIKNQYLDRTGSLMNWQLEATENGTSFNMFPYQPAGRLVMDSIHFSTAILDKSYLDSIALHENEAVFIDTDLDASNQFVYLLLKSDKKVIFSTATLTRNSSRIGILGNYFQKGFVATISKLGLPSDFYRAYVLIKKGKEQRLYDSGKIIRIDGKSKPKEQPKNW